MSYELLFVGVGGTVLGTLLGAWLSSRLTYGFQKKLLATQLEFQKLQAEKDAELRAEIYKEVREIFTEFRNMINTRAAQIVAQLRKPEPDRR